MEDDLTQAICEREMKRRFVPTYQTVEFEDYYNGIRGVYFWSILRTIVGMLHGTPIVLDYGCGHKKLSQLYQRVISYDSNSLYTEVGNWQTQRFDVIVVNQVFYEMTPYFIILFLEELRAVNKNVTLIVGIGRKGWLNKLGAMLLNSNAHNKYKTDPDEELMILKRYCRILEKKSVMFLCDVYKMEFI